MDVIDAIYGRRSIRSYTPEPVSDEDLHAVLDAAMWAPSAVNFQPWYFVAVRSEEKMTQLLEIMQTVSQKIEPQLRSRFEKHPEVVTDTTRFIRQLGGAPVCVLVFWGKPEYPKSASTVNQSVAAAIENFHLAAYAKGLGSCWLTAPVETGAGEQLRDTFAPGAGELVAVLALGHPAKFPAAPRRKDGRYTVI